MKKLIQAFRKFKEDSLSKLFYDIAKWFFGVIVLFISLEFFPKKTSLNEFLKENITIKIYWAIGILILTAVITIALISLIFNKKYRELEKVAYVDEKTGLNSHKLLESYLSEKMEESKRLEKPLSIILIDIDDFKRFNELYTPTIGDKLISKVGEIIREDFRYTDKVFRRYETGDEFVVICPKTAMAEAQKPADRIRKTIEESNYLIEGNTFNATICCGITQYNSESDTCKSLLDRANYAVRNIAKKNPGKNCIAQIS